MKIHALDAEPSGSRFRPLSSEACIETRAGLAAADRKFNQQFQPEEMEAALK